MGPLPLDRAGLRDDIEGMTADRLGTEVPSTNTCFELLRSAEVGRLAVSITDHPNIVPISFFVNPDTVVFRTAEGTKLAAIELPLFPWQPAPSHRFVRIEPHELGGCRLNVVDESAWARPRPDVTPGRAE
jgi:hypothetical protein